MLLYLSTKCYTHRSVNGADSVLSYLVQVRRQDRGGCNPLFSLSNS
nr:MAG TPA: hypothetical protein [Caudoviricetes sp.]